MREGNYAGYAPAGATENGAHLYDVMAEEAVLGSILIDPDAFDSIGSLRADDFSSARNRIIFSAMMELHESDTPVDLTTLCDKLDEKGASADGVGAADLARLLSLTPTAMYADHYAESVRKHGTLRRMIGHVSQVAKDCYEPDANPIEIASRAARVFDGLAGEVEVDDGTDMRTVMERQLARLTVAMDAHSNGKPIGLLSGWALDRVTGGFQAGNVVTVAARPGAGKSSWGLALLLRMALKGIGGIFFSLEMSETEVVNKLVANLTGIDSLKLRNGDVNDDDMTQWMEAAGTLSQIPLHVIDSRCHTLAEIRRRTQSLQQQAMRENLPPIQVICVDYLQLMSPGPGDDINSRSNRQEAISAISRGIKKLAKDLGVIVIQISQLNRGVEARTDKRPLLSDLRDSGGIEQDSDCVIMIYRDDYYNEDSEEQGIAEIIVSKNRHGDTGTRKMMFKRETCRFYDIDVTSVPLNDVMNHEPEAAPPAERGYKESAYREFWAAGPMSTYMD